MLLITIQGIRELDLQDDVPHWVKAGSFISLSFL